MKNYSLLLLLAFVLSCGVSEKIINYKNKPFSSELNDEIFNSFSSAPLSSKYGKVKAVKVLYDVEKKQIYYINNLFSKYHHEFARDYLNDASGLSVFNAHNYSDHAQRKYLLGNVNYYPDLESYIFEISASDEMGIETILQFYNLVKSSLLATKNLGFMLNSNRLMEMKNKFPSDIKVYDPSDIYKNLQYQAIANFEGEGRLIFVEDLEKSTIRIGRNDIVVCKSTPFNIPILSGLIVEEFQTPLSHICILGQNRKIPIFAQRNCFEDAKLRSLEGKLVRLTVSDSNFSIQEISKLSKSNQTRKRFELSANFKIDSLIGGKHLKLKYADLVGNKAAYFGELQFLAGQGNFSVPEDAFAIPFAQYQKHIIGSGAAPLIASLLEELKLSPDADYSEKLKIIRDKIIEHEVSATLVQEISQRLKTSKYQTFRFRSSTNAEDASGFSGAGLYDSKTVDLRSPTKTIEKAIKSVWSSLWNDFAFYERVYFNIDQTNCAMGILVHRSFPDEAVNGVAITKNLYREDYPGFVVNAQLGDVSVVSPPKNIICDQFVCFPEQTDEFYNNTIDVITYSDLNGGKLLMTIEEIKNLASQLDLIKRYFYQKVKFHGLYTDFAMDVEFKLDKETRKLYIKQARIFND